MNTANASPTATTSESSDSEQADSNPTRGKRFSTRFFGLIRWLHIYLSMFGFATILFFSVTGITLNHPTWFGGVGERTEHLSGELDSAWVRLKESVGDESADSYGGVDRLKIAEYLRKTHTLHGSVADFRVDDEEISIAFEGPAYAADVVILRATGGYDLSITRHGLVALINDLHKGRDSGIPWIVVIDLSALLMTVSSITGVVLLFSIRRKRLAGTLTAIAGTIALWLAYHYLVP